MVQQVSGLWLLLFFKAGDYCRQLVEIYSAAFRVSSFPILFLFSLSALFQVQMFETILAQKRAVLLGDKCNQKSKLWFQHHPSEGGGKPKESRQLNSSQDPDGSIPLLLVGSCRKRNDPNSFLKDQRCQGQRENPMGSEDWMQWVVGRPFILHPLSFGSAFV